MKIQRSILPVVLLLATLACTLNAPPGSSEHNLLAEAPITSAVTTATYQVIPNNTSTPVPTVTPEHRITETRTCEVNTLALNVRSGPGLGYPAVAWLYAGDTATIQPTPHPTGWLPIESGDLAGWVKAEFCEVLP